MEPQPQLRDLLNNLLDVLHEERAALRVLDRLAIDACAQKKLVLDAAIRRAWVEQGVTAQERALLSTIRKEAQDNRLLLVHAKSCVQGVFEMLTGQPLESRTGAAQKTPPKPVALNIRG